MADFATFARPYARAAFEVARERGALDAWAAFLGRLAGLLAQQPVRDLVTSPEASRAERAQVLAELVGTAPPAGGENLLHLMADNDRLDALPAVTAEFQRLQAEAETTAKAVVETAVALERPVADRLVDAIGRRLGRTVEATFEVKPEMIGGVIVRVGDHVIDASLATRLTRLGRAMAA